MDQANVVVCVVPEQMTYVLCAKNRIITPTAARSQYNRRSSATQQFKALQEVLSKQLAMEYHTKFARRYVSAASFRCVKMWFQYSRLYIVDDRPTLTTTK